MLNNKIKISILALIYCFSNVSAEVIELPELTLTDTWTVESGPTLYNPIYDMWTTAHWCYLQISNIPYKMSPSVDKSTGEADLGGVITPGRMKISEDNSKIILSYRREWTEGTTPENTTHQTEQIVYSNTGISNAFRKTIRLKVPPAFYDIQNKEKIPWEIVKQSYTCVYNIKTVGVPTSYVPKIKDSSDVNKLLNILKGYLRDSFPSDPSKVERKRKYVGEERG